MNDIGINIKSAVIPGFRLDEIPGIKLLTLPHRQIRNDKFDDAILANFAHGLPTVSSNIVLNHDFSEGSTGWNKTGLWYYDEGVMKISESASDSTLSKTLALVAGSVYQVRVVIPEISTGSLEVVLGSSITHTITENGDHTIYVKSGSTSDLVITAVNSTLSLSSVTVRQVQPGNHGALEGNVHEHTLNAENGVYLDGVNDYAGFGPILNPRESDFFLFCWIKIDANPPFAEKMEIFSKGSYLQFLTLETSGYPGFYLSSGDYRSEIIYNNIANGNWHFLTLYHSTSDGTILKIDNNISSSKDSNQISSLDYNDSLVMGKYPLGRYFKGYIGVTGYCLFDGLDSAPVHLPEDIFKIADNIYRATNYLYL